MNIFTVFSDIKEFFSNIMNTVCVLLLCFCLAILGFQFKITKDLATLEYKIDTSSQKICDEIKINRDKIHFRYFNLTNSLEDINGVKINTKNGKIEH
ncbi:MAG: hypothetical protein ACI37T_09545 [Candidatus Gastranaerophilaceae bacterium]